MKQNISSALLSSLLLISSVSLAAPAKATVLTITSKGDEMAFNKAALNVKAGQAIKLVFENKAAKSSGMQHNWVLVNPGTADAVGQAGMMVGADKGYIPVSADILAHTRLLGAGEKDSIDFNAPAKPGAYPFICTFPGHYTMMKGTLTVK